jgi:hypothetical protein
MTMRALVHALLLFVVACSASESKTDGRDSLPVATDESADAALIDSLLAMLRTKPAYDC